MQCPDPFRFLRGLHVWRSSERDNFDGVTATRFSILLTKPGGGDERFGYFYVWIAPICPE